MRLPLQVSRHRVWKNSKIERWGKRTVTAMAAITTVATYLSCCSDDIGSDYSQVCCIQRVYAVLHVLPCKGKYLYRPFQWSPPVHVCQDQPTIAEAWFFGVRLAVAHCIGDMHFTLVDTWEEVVPGTGCPVCIPTQEPIMTGSRLRHSAVTLGQ